MKKSDKEKWTGFNMGRVLFKGLLQEYDVFMARSLQGILKGKDTKVRSPGWQSDRIVAVEYGCGDGVWLRYLARNNPHKKFIGVEWNDSLYNYCVKQPAMENLEFVQADISEPEGVFECDVCWSLGGIEHFSEPVMVLQAWVDKLSPDGLCFLTVPNLLNRDWLKRKHGMLPDAYLGKDRVITDGYGYAELWAPNYFIKIAMEAGLEVTEMGVISCLKAERWENVRVLGGQPLYLKGLKRADQL